jgi:hypothetical protein
MELICECGACAVCKSRESMRKRRRENPEHVRALDRARYYRDWEKRRAAADDYARRHPEEQREGAMRWRARNPDKRKAQNAANNAVRDGKLIRQSCERAGPDCKGRVHKHHDDYSKPLDVRWLCAHHHGEVHRKF